MDSFVFTLFVFVKNDVKEHLFKKFLCYQCNATPILGSKIYICPPCQKYKCEICFTQHNIHLVVEKKCRNFIKFVILQTPKKYQKPKHRPIVLIPKMDAKKNSLLKKLTKCLAFIKKLVVQNWIAKNWSFSKIWIFICTRLTSFRDKKPIN